MAEQWEYLMVELKEQVDKNNRWCYMIRQLYEDGGRTDRFTDAPKALNEYGAQGWELVSTGNQSSGYGTGDSFLIFKRRKP